MHTNWLLRWLGVRNFYFSQEPVLDQLRVVEQRLGMPTALGLGKIA